VACRRTGVNGTPVREGIPLILPTPAEFSAVILNPTGLHHVYARAGLNSDGLLPPHNRLASRPTCLFEYERTSETPQATPAPRPEPANPNPEDSIGIGQAKMGVAAQRHLELVSEKEILDGHVAARPQTGRRVRRSSKRSIRQDSEGHSPEAPPIWTTFCRPTGRLRQDIRGESLDTFRTLVTAYSSGYPPLVRLLS
jgi:hypothetical protein